MKMGAVPVPINTAARQAELRFMLDDSRALADRAKAAGVEVRLDVFPGMLHSFQMMAGRAPEADDAIARLAQWVRPKLGLAATAATRAEGQEVA